MLIFHTIMLSTHTLIINNELTVTDEGVIIFEKICSLKNSIQLKLAFICWQTGHHIWNRKNFRNKNKYGLSSWWKLKNLPRPVFVKPICWPNICDEYKKSNYSLLDLAWFKKIALVQNAFNYPLMKINLGIANKMLSNKCRNQLFRWFWYKLFFLNIGIWPREDKISTCFSFNYKAKVIFVIVLSFFLFVM